MAYARAFLLLLSVHLCLVTAPHAAAALSFSYNFSRPSDLNDSNLKYLGNATAFGDRISLTNNTANSTSRVVYLQPVRLWDSSGKRASFTTTFSFFISVSADNKYERGDGMAFFIGPNSATTTMPPDANGAYLGLFNNLNNPSNDGLPPPQTVGVEFDTHYNDDLDPPELAPPSPPDHIGIDTKNISSTYYKGLGGLDLSGTMSARVEYDGRSKTMSVSLRLAKANGDRSLSGSVDLMAAGVPQDAYIGFSAATGPQSEDHQLLSWSFSSTDPSKMELWVIILIAAACVSLTGFVAALVYHIIQRQPQNEVPPQIEVPPLPVAREFSHDELSVATNNFCEEIGAGNFGKVYRGKLWDPRMGMTLVAVKELTENNEQTKKDYLTEIMTLRQISHRNIMKLVGWCSQGDKLLLVYELATNKSLSEHLHASERLLTWAKRYKIVLGVGSAIQYLHTGAQNPILHRDIKPSNVMVDEEFEAKLGDFGLVRHAPGQGPLKGTTIIGSFGYIDPVCISTETTNTASDMYSFGVLLLEVATGQMPKVVEAPGLPNALVDAVRKSYSKGAVLEMADPRLDGNFDKSQMERVLVVGLLCVQQDRLERPGIKEAVYFLSNTSHPIPQVIII